MRRGAAAVVACALGALAAAPPGPAPAPTASPFATRAVGGRSVYEVRPGDSLTLVSARFGEDVAPLARANGLAADAWLRIGQRLVVDDLHLVPGDLADGIWINLPQRMLFRIADGDVTHAFPVGLGRPSWPTPLGSFRIGSRERDKTWYVPPSIQEETRRAGKPVRTQVPPGPENPLGGYWLGLAGIACGIHGTNAPASIYHFQTHGCMRAGIDDIASLWAVAAVGDPVRIVYLPVLLGALGDGRLLLEAHRDVYRRGSPSLDALRTLAEAHGVAERIDWTEAAAVLAACDGIARPVGLERPSSPAAGDALGPGGAESPQSAPRPGR